MRASCTRVLVRLIVNEMGSSLARRAFVHSDGSDRSPASNNERALRRAALRALRHESVLPPLFLRSDGLGLTFRYAPLLAAIDEAHHRSHGDAVQDNGHENDYRRRAPHDIRAIEAMLL
jgi:hypothetical protein